MSTRRKIIIGVVAVVVVLLILAWVNMFPAGSSLKETGFMPTQTISTE